MRLLEVPARGFTTRFAPAPTGFLHLGHVANAIAVWGLARAFGGRVLLRIEDHDQSRCRPEYEAALFEDLSWLGFEADEAPVRQSERAALYEEALTRLADKGLVYACDCSRRTIAEASSPGASELRYGGRCRSRDVSLAATPARRVRLAAEEIAFGDLRLGPLSQNPALQCGDVLLRDRNGHWTYQFAVVVDDLAQGVDLVIRGEDLLASTGRQILIARLLGSEAPPRFLHHPLILREDGHKLSKSNRDTGVRDLRAASWTRERVLGAAARALGISDGDPMTFAQCVEALRRSATESRGSV